MILEEPDIAIIAEVFQVYQDTLEKYIPESSRYFGMIIGPDLYRELTDPLHTALGILSVHAPLARLALTGGKPDGYTLLRLVSGQWYAWSAVQGIPLYGPTTEFQARLWCYHQDYIRAGAVTDRTV